MLTQDYKNLPGISNSMIKDFKRLPIGKYKQKWIDNNGYNNDDENQSKFTLGSVVDTLLTKPGEFYNEFIISTEKVPTGKVSDVINDVYKLWLKDVDQNKELKDYQTQILRLSKEHDYGQSWKEPTLLENVYKLSSYFDYLKISKDKTVITMDDNLAAITMANEIKSDKYTSKFFDGNSKFQEIITGTLNGVATKAAIDCLHFNEIMNEITINDFKTTSTHGEYLRNYLKYGYIEQLSFYKALVRQKYPEYGSVKCCNTVIDIATQTPIIYEFPEIRINQARTGYTHTSIINGDEVIKHYKGWEEILDLIKYHSEKNLWNYSKEYTDNHGKIILD